MKRRPLSPARDLSVSYTAWRGDKRYTYAGEGKENIFPQMHIFFPTYF